MVGPTRLWLIRVAAILALSAAGLAGAASPAPAQGFSFFGSLFGGGQPNRAPPPYPGYGGQPGSYDSMPRPRVRRHPVDQVQKEAPRDKPPAAVPATSFVYVFGDSLGQLLANGLDDALSDRPEVAIVHKARGSSGLVAEDFLDWPKTIDKLLASKDKIDVAVMMIGSNDRQSLHEGGKIYDAGSDGWTAAYARRVAAIDEAFRAKGVPLIWVGVPITKDSDFADDMAALNDIFRTAAAKTGATYVDTWEAFSDEGGDFAAYGPDVNGQTVRLRTSDGIYFTKAGARKLAHFVEAHVRRDLDGKAPVTPVTATPDTATLGTRQPTPVLAKAKPEIGPVRDLTETPVARDGMLASVSGHATAGTDAPDGTGSEVQTPPTDHSLASGDTRPAPAGRADDLRWPDAAGPHPPR